MNKPSIHSYHLSFSFLKLRLPARLLFKKTLESAGFFKIRGFVLTALLIVLCTSACKKKDSPQPVNLATQQQESQIQTTKNSHQPKNVVLPEPAVTEKQKLRFKLTNLSAVREKFFKINDDIIFTGLEKQIRKKDPHLKDVTLKIRTHCIVDQNQVLITHSKRKLSQSIPIIELLPAKALLYQESNPPSCGFYFEATHKEGSAHYFELPPLPLLNHTEKRFIHIFDSFGEVTKNFPYVLQDRISDYYINVGTKKMMKELQLICDDFTLSLPLRVSQIIPFSVFPIAELTKEVEKKITKKPVQMCRILGYGKSAENKTLIAISSTFKLFDPRKKMIRVEIEKDLFEERASSFYSTMKQIDYSSKPHRVVPLYSYTLYNQTASPAHLFIAHQKTREHKTLKAGELIDHVLLGNTSYYSDNTELEVFVYNLYVAYQQRPYQWHFRRPFYELQDAYLILSDIQRLSRQSPQKKIRAGKQVIGTVVTLQPKSAIKLSIIIDSKLGFSALCSNDKGRNNNISRWIGTVIPIPDLKMYQLVSNQTDNISFKRNIIRELKNFSEKQNGHPIIIVTEQIQRATSNGPTFYARPGSCPSGNTSDSFYDRPVLKLDKTLWDFQLIDSTKVPYDYHSRIKKHLILNLPRSAFPY